MNFENWGELAIRFKELEKNTTPYKKKKKKKKEMEKEDEKEEEEGTKGQPIHAKTLRKLYLRSFRVVRDQISQLRHLIKVCAVHVLQEKVGI
ncbi:MAG: hypothetical protein JAY75_12000 [Candidatus Thiodiazotropha taylori]|nr:hypothetical protein [Candidatus Thiodiazotropha taylori]MCW4308940.1 hypothetical protein [Candidatus Thiodiazotropha endolucinida]